jgi:hypothetical protein
VAPQKIEFALNKKKKKKKKKNLGKPPPPPNFLHLLAHACASLFWSFDNNGHQSSQSYNLRK